MSRPHIGLVLTAIMLLPSSSAEAADGFPENTITGEDTSDNSVTVTVLVEPRDYATDVRGDAWDMDEDSTIDSERYHMLSLGIVCNNPNRASGSAVDMKIGWVRLEEAAP